MAKVAFQDVPSNIAAKPLVLDATAPSTDEIARLRPEPPLAIDFERPNMYIKSDSYQGRFWPLEWTR